ncbi:hypothetical protein DRF67_01030 [Chryseobacterium pennipullorum]|uniref:Uncharacterized protein n=2 Tax=Chryseobacterium pennipullorum TaxID=2258963 RepID=A0A3D9BA02_9FLAO|nr:hypothetical protein DRF67_01030 [Chryseobacterium pennipullorum]
MKKMALLTGILISCTISAQMEYKTYQNGLIYSEKTMHQLEKIVDSLNLKYKACDLSKIFYSQLQTKGHSVVMKSGEILSAKKDMDMGISLEQFIKKYPDAMVRKDILLVKTKSQDYNHKDITRIREISLDENMGIRIETNYKKNRYNKPVRDRWAYYYRDKTGYSDEYIEAFYFPENFKTIPLDAKYSRQIIYSDCVIDTSDSKFKKGAKEGRLSEGIPENWRNLPKDEKENLLDSLRSVVLVGFCSEDEGPRNQGIYMALLSAETSNWSVFLKSHLDIMNDHFERASDNGYAREQRQTYIKELEKLNINVPDLIFGISLRMENPVENHYYGDIYRLGRAISESKDLKLFLTQLLSMIADEKLDDYNRVLAYFFYTNCNYYIKDKRDQKINNEKLVEAIEKLPKYLSEKIVPETL